MTVGGPYGDKSTCGSENSNVVDGVDGVAWTKRAHTLAKDACAERTRPLFNHARAL